MRKMKFLVIFAALLFCKVQGEGTCKINGSYVDCEKGAVCHVDGKAFGIVKEKTECSYINEIGKSTRAQTPQEKRDERKERVLKIRINQNFVCCPARLASRACAALGKRPVRTRTKRIIGGDRAALAKFPHFAALAYVVESQLSFDCGGALISESFVLTAAHCCPKSTPPIIVRLGKTALLVGDKADHFKPENIDVINIIIHHDYKPSKKYNDIAIIMMKHPAPLSVNIWPACVDVESPPMIKENLSIAGFGIIDSGAKTRSKWLMTATVHEINLSGCKKKFDKEFYKPSEKMKAAQYESIKGLPLGITETMICAVNRDEPPKHVDTCQGDSGTALQYLIGDNVFNIYGITSFGLSCNTRLPSFYTRVSSYIEWIEKIVWTKED